ncbi:MAG TPA: tripartite tricarboxylate transporter substrate binding protein [Burkholderiales bacterium]|nr:tripartite tricarboxylate transporter substrate binding protein [Burkholderiales bacterium]
MPGNRPVVLLLIAAAAGTASAPAAGQPYPARPIRIIVPGTPGSSNDFTARAVAQRLTDAWGQQIVIDNRAGAGGIIGHELAVKSAPDGYTLIFSTSAGLVTNPLLYKVPYDSFRDLAPISLASINPQMLFSHPSVPAANVQELIALARAKPGQLNCASAGTGTPNHLGCEMLKSMAKIDFVHVPYKGATPAITDVVAGQMHFMLNSIPAVLPLARSGKIRALGVAGSKRSVAAPDIPTVAETIPGFQCVNWYAMLAPAGTPPAIVAKLNTEMAKMIADPPFAQRLIELGSEPQSSTPAGLRDFMRSESERWGRVIKAAGIRIER